MESTWSHDKGEAAVLEVFEWINKPAGWTSLVDRGSLSLTRLLGERNDLMPCLSAWIQSAAGPASGPSACSTTAAEAPLPSRLFLAAERVGAWQTWREEPVASS